MFDFRKKVKDEEVALKDALDIIVSLPDDTTLNLYYDDGQGYGYMVGEIPKILSDFLRNKIKTEGVMILQ